jgi:hypothetical protein
MKINRIFKFILVILVIGSTLANKVEENEIVSNQNVVFTNSTGFLKNKGKINIKCSQ